MFFTSLCPSAITTGILSKYLLPGAILSFHFSRQSKQRHDTKHEPTTAKTKSNRFEYSNQ